MPSLPASAKPRSAAFRVCEELTLMAGYAKAPALARSSMRAYTSGVAIGMGSSLRVARASLLALQGRERSVLGDAAVTAREAARGDTGLLHARHQRGQPRVQLLGQRAARAPAVGHDADL